MSYQKPWTNSFWISGFTLMSFKTKLSFSFSFSFSKSLLISLFSLLSTGEFSYILKLEKIFDSSSLPSITSEVIITTTKSCRFWLYSLCRNKSWIFMNNSSSENLVSSSDWGRLNLRVLFSKYFELVILFKIKKYILFILLTFHRLSPNLSKYKLLNYLI